MESRRVDELSRMMANGASRRALLRGVLGGAIAASGFRGGVAAKPSKVDICHRTGNGSYRHISVSVNARDAHLRHGDNGGAGCPEGYEFNQETCACESVKVNECADKDILDECSDGDRYRCARLVDDGTMVCVDTRTGSGRYDCSSSDECASDELCVDDGNPQIHCHPPA